MNNLWTVSVYFKDDSDSLTVYKHCNEFIVQVILNITLSEDYVVTFEKEEKEK